MRIFSVLVAGAPTRPSLLGVMLMSQVPARFKLISQVAVRLLVFLLVVILHVPRTVRMAWVWKRRLALLVATIV